MRKQFCFPLFRSYCLRFRQASVLVVLPLYECVCAVEIWASEDIVEYRHQGLFTLAMHLIMSGRGLMCFFPTASTFSFRVFILSAE